MDRFEIWFGGIFVAMGLIALAIAGVLYAAYGRGARRHPNLWAFLGAPLIIGAIFAVIGSGFVGYGLWQHQIEQHVLANGTTTRAFVRGPEQTLARLNGRYLWRVRYQYQDPNRADGALEGATGLMDADEAQLWHDADLGLIRYDPANPAHSVWLGYRIGSAR
jgi:hypothetical protein